MKNNYDDDLSAGEHPIIDTIQQNNGPMVIGYISTKPNLATTKVRLDFTKYRNAGLYPPDP